MMGRFEATTGFAVSVKSSQMMMKLLEPLQSLYGHATNGSHFYPIYLSNLRRWMSEFSDWCSSLLQKTYEANYVIIARVCNPYDPVYYVNIYESEPVFINLWFSECKQIKFFRYFYKPNLMF